MKVCVLTEKFAPHAGGSAVVWTEWCKRWPADSLRVITRVFPGWEACDRELAFKVDRVPFLDVPKLRMPYVWLRIFVRLLRQCRIDKPDLLHCAQIIETAAYAPWIRSRFGIPYAVHTYGEEIAAYSRLGPTRSLMQKVLAGADLVTAISRYTERQLRDGLDYQGEVLLVPPGVDTSRFVPGDRAAARAKLGWAGDPILLTMARLLQRKGHERVLQVLPGLIERWPGLQYYIAGVGPMLDPLRKLAEQHGLANRVHFLGRLSDEDYVSALQAADVFVHPNYVTESGDVEGFGIVFLEAAACGIPVIGGASGGTADAVGGNGLLVDSVNDLQEALQQLLADPSRRAAMGAAGIEWARRFTWDAAAAAVWERSVRARG